MGFGLFAATILPGVIPPAKAVLTAASPPVIVGWGGTAITEVGQGPSTNPSSAVFPGERASNMEMTLIRMKQSGYNGIRVLFGTGLCGTTNGLAPYDGTNFDRAIQISQHYDFWFVPDFEGDEVMQTDVNRTCWLNFWSGVVSQFENSYAKIVWEPSNEPIGITVARLSESYQMWINQARSLGDSHWIVAENLCSNSCPFNLLSSNPTNNYVAGNPTVSDSQNMIFLSLHPYMYYEDVVNSALPWNNATAEQWATAYFNAILTGTAQFGWPTLNTEGGAVPCCGSPASPWPPDGRPNPGVGGCTMPCNGGSAGWSVTSFHFIQYLTNLMDNHSPRINWIWWHVGDWSDSPLREPNYGALSSPDGWGSLLQHQTVIATYGSTPTITFTWSPTSPTRGQTITFIATVSGGVGPYNFAWDFGDSSTARGARVTHAYSVQGRYNVTVAVSDSTGRTKSMGSYVTVGGTSSNVPQGLQPYAIALASLGAAALLGLLVVFRRRRKKSLLSRQRTH